MRPLVRTGSGSPGAFRRDRCLPVLGHKSAGCRHPPAIGRVEPARHRFNLGSRNRRHHDRSRRDHMGGRPGIALGRQQRSQAACRLRCHRSASAVHVYAWQSAVRGHSKRRALGPVPRKGGLLMAAQQRAVGVHHPPPCDAASPQGHDAADLTRSAVPEERGHVAVGHDAARRDGVDHIEHPARVVVHVRRVPRHGLARRVVGTAALRRMPARH